MKTDIWSVQWIVLTAILLALTLTFQMIGLPQYLTGPVVNAMLILSAFFVGPSGGIIIGLLTPLIAFIRGILPAPLAPLIPFIMASNALFVLLFWACYHYIKNSITGSILGVLLSSSLKFLLLSVAVRFLVNVPKPVAQMMQLPQFINAIIGGAIALAVYKGLKTAIPGIYKSKLLKK